MIHDPTEIIKEYPLYPKGIIQIGRGKQTGMRVGSDPLMARFLIPEDCGLYPSDWFAIANKPMMKIFSEIEKESIDTKEGKVYFLPEWMVSDCFRSAWEKLYWEKRLEK